ncbi:MAG: BCSC C-terminal domain-containing protein, partial [Desulfobacterales bacterium]|nr:BCSC C-terminal domain-containing protein [Desulfobacterales bacterium]
MEIDPKNHVAHRELGRVYAWKGDNDQAIYHSKRALKYNSQDTIASSLKANLMKGREPKILAGLTYLNQSGDDGYDYSGYILKAGAKADLTPFLTARLDIGRESFEDDLPDIDGTFLNLVVQYRLDPTRRFDVSWTYHDFDDSEDDTENEFNIRYSFQKGDFRISPGVKREIKYDSMLSIAGAKDEVTQKNIGSARSNSIYCKFLYQKERFHASALPYAGYVSAESTDDNFFVGTDADARYYFIEDGAFSFSTQYKFQIYHYEDDNSGFEFSSNEPFAGGYFSPQLFLNNVLILEFGYQFDNEAVLQLEAGPSFQYANESSDDASWDIGGEVHLSYQMPLAKSLYLDTEGNYIQTSDVYDRYTLSANMVY